MKQYLGIFLIVLCNFSNAQNSSDSIPSKDIVKTGWNFGVLPAVSYNTDLGFQYGLLFSPFYYGDGHTYPNYIHKFYFEASRYTKGSGIYRAYYQSKYLIKNINTIFDVSYLPDLAYDFYGFNGNQTVYNKNWITPKSSEYISSYFYETQKKMFRVKADFLGKTKWNNVGWIGAFQFRNISYSRPDFALLNKGKSATELIPSDTTLYDIYITNKLIPQNEKDGGVVSTLKAGLLYDTRDFESNPSKGLWTEAVVSVSPSFMGTAKSYGVFNFTHRQYVSLIPKRVIFAYRCVYQSLLFGTMPFYVLPEIETTVLTAAYSEGMGGAGSLRGILRNKVVGNQIAFGNFEMRYKFVKFKVAKQNLYIATNIFSDLGAVLKPISIDFTQLNSADRNRFFSDSYKGIHSSAGIGLKIAMNENFILSIDYGKALQKNDGSTGMYIRLNYLF